MNKYQTLKQAPIAEALVDIQVGFSSRVEPEALQQVYTAIRDRYPNREQQGFIQFSVTNAQQSVPLSFNAATGFAGYRYSSEDKKHILQVGSRGFTFSRLAPYSNGDEFRVEARELWKHYIDATNPVIVRRLALRCINRILIPLPFQDLSEYFRTFVTLPPEIPQGIVEFLLRVVLPSAETPEMVANVTVRAEPLQENATQIPILFDIDVYQVVRLRPDSEEIWDVLEALRRYRNQIFFESLTEKALRMYQ